ncbi:MAG: hypothetical protein CMI60_21100 [Parvibaculum sp.]|nr:hypothetical protein [Parvibaculum sp.]|tara:strand:- start:32 stop:316 length:285 start_codon:yes stop_codon:yes gene_type:complete
MIEALKNKTGWAALDIEGFTQIDANVVKGREIASQFHECFRTDAGQYVLNRLISITLLRPTVTPAATQFEAGIREGRADIVRQILTQLETAEKQ